MFSAKKEEIVNRQVQYNLFCDLCHATFPKIALIKYLMLDLSFFSW